MSVKNLDQYTEADMVIPEFRDAAKPQLVKAIRDTAETAERHIQGLTSGLSVYASLRQHPAYVHLSAEHHAREVQAARELYLAVQAVADQARTAYLELDPEADI